MTQTDKYYVMTCEGLYPNSTLGRPPRLPRGPWMTGQAITYAVPQPLRYTLDAKYPGKLRPLYESNAPLMRRDLLDALDAAGVDNLQLFDVVLADPNNQAEHQDYKAVNIVGLVSAADMERSVRMGISDSELIDADFDRLVFDEKRPAGLLLFRLAENAGAIVVHEKVKNVIEERKIPGMTFYASGEWAG
jgi:hypothetical protein